MRILLGFIMSLPALFALYVVGPAWFGSATGGVLGQMIALVFLVILFPFFMSGVFGFALILSGAYRWYRIREDEQERDGAGGGQDVENEEGRPMWGDDAGDAGGKDRFE